MKIPIQIPSSANKTKIIVINLPPKAWEHFNELVAIGAEKIPGLTHDMIVSACVLEMLRASAKQPYDFVSTEPEKLPDTNPS